MGIARAYKAPSLYQTNPNYILYSKGQGCYASAGGCYLQGNDDLKAETSINKEIGLEFKRDGWLAGVTWFRNDYLYREIICRKFHRTLINQRPFEIRQYCILYDAV